MAPAVPSADRASKTELANAIYSRDDSEVQPPVMLYPQMPPPLIVGGPPEGIVNSMELVIAPDGSVERVRLISAPRRMADMMLLSGAKLWRFSPAVKDGKPVRYRTTLSWTVFP
jgi:outer membrane biosynthesis protein TonB